MRVVAAWGSEVSLWKSVDEVFCHSCLHSCEKWGQSKMTCLAVSHCHSQGQAGDPKLGTWHWCRKAASPILPVRIWVSRLLCGFGRLVCSWRDAALCGILLGFQPSPGSELVSWRRGGGSPSSSLQWSQHHGSASW